MEANERLKILEKVASGALTASDAADLLQASRKAETAATPPGEKEETVYKSIEITEEPLPTGNGKKPRWLHVRVDDLSTGESRVSIRIPLKLMRFGLQMGRRFTDELDGLDLDELVHAVSDGGSGMLVDVKDSADGEHVQVYIE